MIESRWDSLDDPEHLMTAEHLMAIALQTGRAKDHARLVMFVEAGSPTWIACATSSPATRCLMRGEVRESFPPAVNPDLQHIIQSKEAERRRLRALPWLEKLEMLDRLR